MDARYVDECTRRLEGFLLQKANIGEVELHISPRGTDGALPPAGGCTYEWQHWKRHWKDGYRAPRNTG